MLMQSAQLSQHAEPLCEDRPRRSSAAGWWASLFVLLAANLPLVTCMPLTADPITYDLQARTALEGGILYRDIVEPNLPGVVWVHMAVRSLIGWSSYALRSFDLTVFAGVIVLLLRILRGSASENDSRAQRPLVALLLCWIYFSMSEWVHCQRDIWLLLPALGALSLRLHQLNAFSAGESGRNALLFWGGIEGIVWGIAFWIKPFIALPAVAAFVVSAFLMRNLRASLFSFSGVLAGGIFAGLCGSVWLIETGAWPHFWDMALNWNPEYFEMGRSRWSFERYLSMFQRFLPWSLIPVAAVPVAVRNLVSLRQTSEDNQAHAARCLLSAVFLGWLIQAHTLQYLFDYVHVPGILLGVGVLAASWPARRSEMPVASLSLASLLLVALIASPATRPARLAWWGRCLTEGSTPEVRSALQHRPLPDWEELEPIVDFLKAKNLEDQSVTAYNVFLIHLYPELGLMPSTRYVFPDVHTRLFKSRTAMIEQALENSPQQFVISSLLENGMDPEDISPYPPEEPPVLPAGFPEEELRYFPFNQTLVFRSGQYVVHQVTRPVGPLNTRFYPLASRTIDAP